MAVVKICPSCGGKLTAISERTGGFSGGKAVVGVVLAGPVGLAAGALGKKLVTLQCENCGYTIEVKEKNAQEVEQYNQAVTQMETQAQQAQDQPFREDEYVNIIPVGASDTAGTLYLPKFRSPLLTPEEWALQRRQDRALAVGKNHILALKADGTVVAAGENEDGRCDVGDWTDMIALTASETASFGLRADGTVAAAGKLAPGMEDVLQWKDIIDIQTQQFFSKIPYVMGLKKDGTVCFAGQDMYDKLISVKEKQGPWLKDWENVRFIEAGDSIFYGICSDGKNLAFGKDYDGHRDNILWSEWQGLEIIAPGYGCTYGIRKDGVVLRAGYRKEGPSTAANPDLAKSIDQLNEVMFHSEKAAFFKNQCGILFDLSWNAGAVTADYDYILSAEGLVYSKRKQEDPNKWHDMVTIKGRKWNFSDINLVGIRSDGVLVASISNPEKKNDGMIKAVKSWKGLYVAPGLRDKLLHRIVERSEEEAKFFEEEQRRKWRAAGKCQHCGGDLSFFGKKCKSCGTVKDY